MIHREVTEHLQFLAAHRPVTCVLGPRQAGKTTLAKHCFPTYKYFVCDDKKTLAIINADAAAFLRAQLAVEPGIIIDEFQLCPDILPAIKVYVDEMKSKGRIIITGSQNYLMMANITQSLAGRVALFDLLSLSINELKQACLLPQNIDELMFNGGYPEVYVNAAATKSELYDDYIKTYLERDVRALKNVPDLSLFHRFIQVCANRIGQLLNLNTLAADAKIDVKTAQQWLSLLEACYVVVLLQPHYNNFNKTLTKSPKLYFYDTGLAAELLKISTVQGLGQHSMRGSLFENFVISECIKWHATKKRRPYLYFWRDEQGHEIDLIIEHAEKLIPVEIKSANAARNTMTDELVFWHNLTGHPLEESYVVYTGPEDASPKGPSFVPWETIPEWLTKLLQLK